jgi:hypothetical protein
VGGSDQGARETEYTAMKREVARKKKAKRGGDAGTATVKAQRANA